jgi:hypothetical protein
VTLKATPQHVDRFDTPERPTGTERRDDAETRLAKRAQDAWRKPAPSMSEPAAAPAKPPAQGNERNDASPLERAKDAWKRKGDL